MPTRYIKDSARTSKNLSCVSDFSERLFWRLITTADDYGRFMACPAIVKANCLPLIKHVSESKVSNALISLQSAQLIGLYTVGDRQFGWFINWEIHQGAPRAKSSKYPDIPTTSLTLPTSVGMCGHLPTDSLGAPNTNTNLNSLLPDPDLKSKNHSPVVISHKKGKRAISDEDHPTDKHRELGIALGVDIGPEWGKFKNYCLAHDKRYANFEAAFRNWIANAQHMNGGKRP